MCFKNKEGKRLLLNSKHKYASGNRFLNLKIKDENRSNLEINVTHVSGDISIRVIDENNKDVYALSNPENGLYTVQLEVNKKYRIDIRLSKHIGSYSFYL